MEVDLSVSVPLEEIPSWHHGERNGIGRKDVPNSQYRFGCPCPAGRRGFEEVLNISDVFFLAEGALNGLVDGHRAGTS